VKVVLEDACPNNLLTIESRIPQPTSQLAELDLVIVPIFIDKNHWSETTPFNFEI